MKERPILFSGEMVRAILDGRKTQSRRVVKPQHQGAIDIGGASYDADSRIWAWHDSTGNAGLGLKRFACPYGVSGDRLWVKETWQVFEHESLAISELSEWYAEGELGGDVVYYADDPDEAVERWRQSIHMPRWASRITLKVIGVRVERLQEIRLADCAAEGAPPTHPADNVWDSTDTYRKLWNRINGPGSWAKNPWVWVVEFKLVTEGGAA